MAGSGLIIEEARLRVGIIKAFDVIPSDERCLLGGQVMCSSFRCLGKGEGVTNVRTMRFGTRTTILLQKSGRVNGNK